MSRIFISYRREDTAFVSGLIHERLAAHFGSDAIFTDIDSIPLGVDFTEYIDEQVGQCDIFLAVIGKEWLSATDDEGRPRLQQPEDFVRLEIESALNRQIPVIPLLVGEVKIPSADELPEALKKLSRRNGTPIRPKPTFDADVERLIRGIERHLEKQAKAEEEGKAQEEQRRRDEEQARRKAEEEQRRTEARAPTQGAVGAGIVDAPSETPVAQTAEPRRVTRRGFLGRAATGWAWLLVGVVVAALVGGVWWYQSTPVEVSKTPAPGTVFRDTLQDGTQGPQMVVIPAGSFLMGSPASEVGRDDDEGPQRRETIGKFAMGKFEVTNAEYRRFRPEYDSGESESRTLNADNQPVVMVSWDDAVAYADWLSQQTGKRYRLPSEAEWEYAARAGTETAYWWGDDVGNNRANCRGCGSEWVKSSVRVGWFDANAFGLFDTAGNVSEWVQDCYHDGYNGAPSDGAAWETGGCSRRVLRGGSWNSRPENMRSAYRDRETPDSRDDGLGFRLAQDMMVVWSG